MTIDLLDQSKFMSGFINRTIENFVGEVEKDGKNGNLMLMKVKIDFSKLLRIITVFPREFYKDLIFILFICLIWLASKSIQVIVNDVETRFSKIQDVSVHRVIEWKRNYFLTLDWIEEINGFFGPVLVICLAHIFLTTSTYSFQCLNGIFSGSNENPLTFLVTIVRNITTTSALIVVTQIMKNQVKFTSYSYFNYDKRFIKLRFNSIL